MSQANNNKIITAFAIKDEVSAKIATANLNKVNLTDSTTLDSSTIGASAKAVNTLYKLIKENENVPDVGEGIVKEIARRYKSEKDGVWTIKVIPYKPVHITAKLSITHADSTCYLRVINGADITTSSGVDAYNYGGYVGKSSGYLTNYDMVIIPTSSSLTLKTQNINTFKDNEYLIAYQ